MATELIIKAEDGLAGMIENGWDVGAVVMFKQGEPTHVIFVSGVKGGNPDFGIEHEADLLESMGIDLSKVQLQNL